MELASPGQHGPALLALEPEQWLEHELRDPGLERMSDHLCAGRFLSPLSHFRGSLSPLLGGKQSFPQRTHLLWHQTATGIRLWRPPLLCSLLLYGPGPPRTQGPLRRLLGTKC